MTYGNTLRIFWISMTFMLLVSISSAIAASITYSPTHADGEVIPITANQLKPSQCSALNLTNIISGSGNIQGSNQADLILGSPSADKINAKKGNDCIVSGNGDDEIRGGMDDDVLVGGSGDDELKGENGTDVCYGEAGLDTSDGTCETVYGIP
jgi:hypothetical protein